MKWLASFGLVVLIAVLGWTALAPAAAAQPDARFSVRVDRRVLASGEQLSVTATANVACGWALEWNGDRRAKADTRVFVTTYTAPQVSRATRIPLRARCFYDSPSAPRTSTRAARPRTGHDAAAQRITVTVPPSWNRTVQITVLPQGSALHPPNDGGHLPSTGGPRLWFLLAGLGSLLAGAVALRFTRRGPAAP